MDFDDLARELDLWSAAGRTATLWWRDDDAVSRTRQLDRLLAVADGVPVALAAIPDLAERGLADYAAGLGYKAILQHGWRHQRHTAAPDPPSEYPPHRRDDEVLAELRAGRERLAGLFGERALAVFAPPWHGFADRFVPLLPAAGLTAISRLGARGPERIGAVLQRNVHAVLTNWSELPEPDHTAQALRTVVSHLRARRRGPDGNEPTGILTHHLVESEQTYRFVARLLAATRAHPAARWLAPIEVFPEAPAG